MWKKEFVLESEKNCFKREIPDFWNFKREIWFLYRPLPAMGMLLYCKLQLWHCQLKWGCVDEVLHSCTGCCSIPTTCTWLACRHRASSSANSANQDNPLGDFFYFSICMFFFCIFYFGFQPDLVCNYIKERGRGEVISKTNNIVC